MADVEVRRLGRTLVGARAPTTPTSPSDGKPVAAVPDRSRGKSVACRASAAWAVAGGPHPKEAERLLRFLMSTKRRRPSSRGPQTIGLLPESVARDVRPPWLAAGSGRWTSDWARAAKGYSESTKAIKDLLKPMRGCQKPWSPWPCCLAFAVVLSLLLAALFGTGLQIQSTAALDASPGRSGSSARAPPDRRWSRCSSESHSPCSSSVSRAAPRRVAWTLGLLVLHDAALYP